MPLHPIHRRRLLHARGFRVAVGPDSQRWIQPEPASPSVPVYDPTTRRTDTTADRPTADTKLCGFVRIQHPAALAGDANAGFAWFGLHRTKIGSRCEQLALTGYKVDLRSPRTADAGNAKAWSSAGGFDAFIVIGRNLSHVTPDAWTRAPAPLPLSGTLNAIPAARPRDGRIISVISFPGGSIVDAIPGSKDVVREFGLELYPFSVGDTLDVALVVQASRIATGSAVNYVDGFALVELKTADLFRSAEFT